MLKELPLANTTVVVRLIGDVAEQLFFNEPHRVFYLVQNQDTVESILVTTDQGGGDVGQIIGPSGAKVIDLPCPNALWARNPNNANKARVSVEQIIGYSPLQLRELAALEKMAGIK